MNVLAVDWLRNLATPTHFTSLLILFIVLFCPLQSAAQGFGRSKITTQLNEKYPPTVYVANPDLQIQVSAQPNINPNFAQQLQEGLERALPRNDWRLNLVRNNPETVVSCVITEIKASSKAATVMRNVYKKIGEHTVYDSTTGASQTVEDFGYVMEQFNVTTLEDGITIEYQVINKTTGDTLDDDLLTLSFKQDYESNAPSLQAALTSLIDIAASRIATRFLPSFSARDVRLPKGKLKEASYFIEDGLWNSAIQELKKIAVFKKDEDEAYRLYALGIAYEGLAYESPDLASTKLYLEHAAAYHDNASRKNFNEPDFQEAAVRTTKLVQAYKRIEGAILAYEERRKQRGLKVMEASKIHAFFQTTNVITNETIISWVRTGVADKEALKRIRTLRFKYFDLSADGIAELTNAGVSTAVIDEMRRAMLPNQYATKPQRKWLGYVAGYALAFYPFLLLH